MIKEIIGRKMAAERDRAGLSLEEVAGKIGLSRQTLSLVEKGQKVIDSEKLLKFARLVGRSVSHFFEEKTPEVQLFFRAHSTQEITPPLEGDLKERYLRYVELEEILGIKPSGQLPQSIPLRSFSEDDKKRIGAVAQEERKRLGISDAPIKSIFELLEHHGVRILVFDFGDPDLVGSGVTCYHSESGPCIFVNANSKIPAERRIFTAAHEYGHLIFHRDEFVDLHSFRYRKGVGKSKSLEEKITDFFAGVFLVPEERLRKIASVGYRITPADVIYIKHIFNVSFKAILERLHQCSLINSQEKRKLYAWLGPRYKAEEEPHPLDSDQLQINKRFENLLRKAYESELISVNKVGELSGKSMREVRDMVREWGEFGSES
jgi:Zn-dependent peptidase ImmA (M78 family)